MCENKNIAKLRISAHKLRIETDRFSNKHTYIPPELRLCLNCESNVTEDELHFVIECKKYQQLRNELFRKCMLYNKYFVDYSNDNKFMWIMLNENLGQLNNFGEYINGALRLRHN